MADVDAPCSHAVAISYLAGWKAAVFAPFGSPCFAHRIAWTLQIWAVEWRLEEHERVHPGHHKSTAGDTTSAAATAESMLDVPEALNARTF